MYIWLTLPSSSYGSFDISLAAIVIKTLCTFVCKDDAEDDKAYTCDEHLS